MKSLLVPTLPPITREQISKEELASFLEEEDYSLSTMVSKFSNSLNKEFIIIPHP